MSSSEIAYKRYIEPDEGAGAIPQVPYVVRFVVHAVLDDHVSIANALVRGWNHKIVAHFPVHVVLLVADDCAPVHFVSPTAHQPLRVDNKTGILWNCHSFYDLNILKLMGIVHLS